MFPNSSGLFFSLFLFMQREILCHIYPRKVPTLIHLARGKNLMPPKCLPDASQMPPQMPLRCLSDASQMPPDASPKKLFGVSRWGNFKIRCLIRVRSLDPKKVSSSKVLDLTHWLTENSEALQKSSGNSHCDTVGT